MFSLRRLVFSLLVLLSLFSNVFAANNLNKVVYSIGDIINFSGNNKGMAKKKNDQLELGSFIFYFSKKPIVNLVPVREMDIGFKKLSFVFPKAKFKDSDCGKVINDINNINSFDFNLKISKIEKPIDGIKLVVTYDPNKVAFNYDFFDPINFKGGIVFKFYNKNLMDNIKNQNDAVLQVASIKKKSLLLLTVDMEATILEQLDYLT